MRARHKFGRIQIIEPEGFAATIALFAVNADAAQQVDFSKVEVKTTDLGNKTYMLEGQGGNVTIAVSLHWASVRSTDLLALPT